MEQSLTNMRYVRTLLERHGFHFSKKLGQNFLINPDVCPRIAEMGNAKPEHGILEIGTGIGTLTAEACRKSNGCGSRCTVVSDFGGNRRAV